MIAGAEPYVFTDIGEADKNRPKSETMSWLFSMARNAFSKRKLNRGPAVIQICVTRIFSQALQDADTAIANHKLESSWPRREEHLSSFNFFAVLDDVGKKLFNRRKQLSAVVRGKSSFSGGGLKLDGEIGPCGGVPADLSNRNHALPTIRGDKGVQIAYAGDEQRFCGPDIEPCAGPIER